MLDPFVGEWLGLVLRWFHFMMGVAWIGASFYFIWLNNSVRPPTGVGREGVAGELWAVHGGAFYQVTKMAGAPAKLPEVLHWFKWEAYLTWLSGFALLVLIWWAQAGTWMVDPKVADLSAAQAVGVGAASLFGGWLVYDGLCRSPLRTRSGPLAGLILAFIVGVAWGLSQLLSPRAAYVHTGAMLGTWMAANVLFIIIPGQRAMVDAMVEGRPPPVERGQAGALRSLHNNYLTLPVLFVMISGHFPATWGHPRGWAVLIALGLCGAAYRHWVNLDERGVHRPWIAGLAAIGLAGLGWYVAPQRAVAQGGPAVPFVTVQQVLVARCLVCHATEPIQPGVATAPKGLVLETPDQIRAAADRIGAQVASGVMPLGNVTGMTDEERALIAAWVAQAR